MEANLHARIAGLRNADERLALVNEACAAESFWSLGIPLPHALRRATEAAVSAGDGGAVLDILTFAADLADACKTKQHAVPIMAGLKLQLPYLISCASKAMPDYRNTLESFVGHLKLSGTFAEDVVVVFERSLDPAAQVPRPPSPPRLPQQASAQGPSPLVAAASGPHVVALAGPAGGPVARAPELPISRGVRDERDMTLGQLASLGRVVAQQLGPYTAVSSAAMLPISDGHVEPGRIDARTREFIRKAHAIYKRREGQQEVRYGDGDEAGEQRSYASGSDASETSEESGSESEAGTARPAAGTGEQPGKRRRKRVSGAHILEDRGRYMAHAFDRFQENRALEAAGRSGVSSAGPGGPGPRGTDRAGIGMRPA